MRIRAGVLALLAASAVHPAFSQDGIVLFGIPASLSKLDATSGTGTLRLQFLDAKTGAAVKPDAVILDGAQASAAPDASGLLVLPNLADGLHQLHIEAANYQAFSASATVSGKDTLVQSFELDPMPQPEDDLTTLGANECLIHGHVVDDLRGSVLPGTQVSVQEKGANATSDEKGRYVMSIAAKALKTTRGEVTGAERVTIAAAREGYKAREFRNVETAPGSRLNFPIRLQRVEDVDDADGATSAPEVIEQVSGGITGQRNYDWVFDVTVR